MIIGTQTILINKSNKLLIAKRAEIKKLAPGRWNFIGGKVEKTDKDIYEGAKREIFEEVGINIDLNDLKLVGKKIVSWENGEPFKCNTFIYYLKETDKVSLNIEHSEYDFIDLNEFDQYNIVGYSKEEIKRYINGVLS